MFGLREVLYDLRRFELSLDVFLRSEDPARAPEGMKEIVSMMLYEIMPHTGPHMGDLEKSLLPFFPEAEIDNDDA